jgi:hypothetical protein
MCLRYKVEWQMGCQANKVDQFSKTCMSLDLEAKDINI